MTDLLKIIAELPISEGYSKRDRYQDFHQLFKSAKGKRVLREMLSWGRMFKTSASASPVDPYLMAIREGQRNMAIRLLATINQEPVEQPTKTRNK